jgi:hypothetical protein
MADHKKTQAAADDQKASSITQEQTAVPAAETKKRVRKAPKVKKPGNKPGKKGLPIAVDILIVFLLLAVIAGIAWGVYKLVDYYATEYVQREISYTLLVQDADASIALDEAGECVVLPDTVVYVSDQGQDTPIGEVTSVSVQQNEQGNVDVWIVVSNKANYNRKLGYFANQIKIAVGKTYTCRFCNLYSEAVIVELQLAEGES